MALEDLLDDGSDDEVLCPICEQPSIETDYWFNRCDNDSCDVITWIPTDR